MLSAIPRFRFQMAESSYDALSQVSPITAGSNVVISNISSLNAGTTEPHPPLGYHAMVAAVSSRQASPARSVASSVAGSTSSGAARARAQRHRERAAQLDRQAEEEDREMLELGVVEDIESFERLNLQTAADQPLPIPTAPPQVFGMDAASRLQIDQAVEGIRVGQWEVEQASLQLQAQAQFQANQMAAVQQEFARAQQQQNAEAARIAQQELEQRNQFEAQALARRNEIVDAQAQFHQAQLQLNIQRQQVELREQEIQVGRRRSYK